MQYHLFPEYSHMPKIMLAYFPQAYLGVMVLEWVTVFGGY